MKIQKSPSFVIYMELGAFLLLICISWADEVFSLSQRIFRGNHSPDWYEAVFESIMIILVAIPTLLITKKVVNRLHYLEGFLNVCGWCKKIGRNDEWQSMEEYFDKNFRTKTSHGICPSCREKMIQEAKAKLPPKKK